jgi:hypothetical protein
VEETTEKQQMKKNIVWWLEKVLMEVAQEARM